MADGASDPLWLGRSMVGLVPWELCIHESYIAGAVADIGSDGAAAIGSAALDFFADAVVSS